MAGEKTSTDKATADKSSEKPESQVETEDQQTNSVVEQSLDGRDKLTEGDLKKQQDIKEGKRRSGVTGDLGTLELVGAAPEQVGKKPPTHERTLPDGSRITMDGDGCITKIINANGVSREFKYGHDGQVNEVMEPSGRWQTTDGRHWVNERGAKWDGTISVWEDGRYHLRDLKGELSVTRAPDGSEVTTNKDGTIIKTKDANGVEREYTYGDTDSRGFPMLTGVKEPTGNWRRTEGINWVNENGDKWTGTIYVNPSGGYEYDDGHVRTTKQLDGKEWISYGPRLRVGRGRDGAIEWISDHLGLKHQFGYGATGQLNKVTERSGETWETNDGKTWTTKDGKTWKGTRAIDQQGTYRMVEESGKETRETIMGVTYVKETNGRITLTEQDGTTKVWLPAPEDIQRLFEKNVSRLDTDEDGFVGEAELDAAIHNPEFTGEDAQLVSVLKWTQDDLEELSDDELGDENDGITRSDIQAFAKLVPDDSTLVRQAGAAWTRSDDSLKHANKSLFANNADPLQSIKPEAVRQGGIGDCVFLAATAALAKSNPQAIRDMIQDNKDGTYTVTFPGDPDHPVTVTAPTDAELAHYVRGSEHGTWPAVLEKAYGTREGGSDAAQDAADGGSTVRETTDLLSPHGSDYDELPLSDKELSNKLREAIASGHPIITGIDLEAGPAQLLGITDGIHDETGLQMGHAYSVLGYDPDKKIVTVRNPWGNGETVNADGTAKDGRDDGVFEMTLEEFQNTFSAIYYGRSRSPRVYGPKLFL